MHYMRGMSLFIVIDSEKKAYEAKLIDLASFEEMPREGEATSGRDEGLIKGIASLLCLI